MSATSRRLRCSRTPSAGNYSTRQRRRPSSIRLRTTDALDLHRSHHIHLSKLSSTRTLAVADRSARRAACMARIVLCKEVDVQRDKLAKVVGRTSTVASTINFVWPTSVASIMKFITLSVHLCRVSWQYVATIVVLWWSSLSPEFGTKFQLELQLFLE